MAVHVNKAPVAVKVVALAGSEEVRVAEAVVGWNSIHWSD